MRCTTARQPKRRRYDDTEHLSVTCGQRVLAPGASTDIVLAFTPREQRAYAEKLRLVILGLSTASGSHVDLAPLPARVWLCRGSARWPCK